MATRKVKDAIDISTNEPIYFLGHAKATYMSDGTTVEDAINNIKNNSGGGNSTGSGAYSEVNHGTSDTTFTLTPNTFHVWDEVSSLSITLGEETSGIANEYLFQFTSGTEPTTLVLPDTIKWQENITIESNKTYQISILKGFGTIMSWENLKKLFPLNFETTYINSDLRQRESDELSLMLFDYLENNAVFNGYNMYDYTFNENDFILDGYSVISMYRYQEGSVWEIHVNNNYGFGGFCVIYLDSLGVIHVINDD